MISGSVNKTDDNEARGLALFLSKDLLPEVRMPSKEHAEVKSLAQSRDKGLEAVLKMVFSPMTEVELRILVEQVRSLTNLQMKASLAERSLCNVL